MVSSVAFSLYDGGDSEDESDDDIVIEDEETGAAQCTNQISRRLSLNHGPHAVTEKCLREDLAVCPTH